MFESVELLRLERVAAACAARDTALLEVALAVADAVEHGAFAAAGLSHGPSWLRAYTETSRDDARRAVALGRLLAMHGRTREAVESGGLAIGRAAVLAGAVTDDRRPAYLEDEETLLAQAAAVHRVEDVEVLVAHWCAMVDQDLSPGIDRPQRLHLQHRFDGGASLRGELDAATTEALRAGLDAFDTGPDPTNGPTPVRSLAERRADALGDMARHAVAGSDEQAPGPKSTRITNLVIDLPTLAGRSRTDLEGIVAALDRRPIAGWAARELLCDTWIAGVVLDAKGVVIDATEQSADFTETQRRLIAVRDGGCVFPGCAAPPSWCDVHHLHWKTNGGGRKLENGALLCRRHHTLLHRRFAKGKRWTLERRADGDGWQATSPDGTTWSGRPLERAGHEPPGESQQAA